MKYVLWLKNITADVQGSINISAEHLVKNRENSGLLSPSLQLESKQNTSTAAGIKCNTMAGIVSTEAKQFFPLHFFLYVTISQQRAAQLSPADSEQLNNFTGKGNE